VSKELLGHFESFFFEEWAEYTYPKYSEWTQDDGSWGDVNFLNSRRKYITNNPYKLIHKGTGNAGKLIGGCIEITEMMKGTGFGISQIDWMDSTFFFETSEEKPSSNYVKYALRSYGVAGAWVGVKNIIIGKSRGYTDEEYLKLEEVVRQVVVEEFEANHITIVSNYDIGHTQPILILPLGCNAVLDESLNLKLLESPFK
jgi:muramoyltetrapeptide carboxypeptidase LdcA involved in peptidoglycan recycling